MQWFRAYQGLCQDPKLHKAARGAGVRRSVAIACWMAVLEVASAHEPRGTIDDMDGDTLGYMVGESKAVGARMLAQFYALGMILKGGTVAAWEKRQRQSDDSAERKKKQRQARVLPDSDKIRQNPTEHESSQPSKPLETLGSGDECHGTKPPRTEQIEEEPPIVPRAGDLVPVDPPDPEPDPEAPPDPGESKRRRATALPDGFALDDSLRAYAEAKCPGVDADAEFERFCDHHRSKGSQFKDWRAAWRTWAATPYGKRMRQIVKRREVQDGWASQWN